MIGSNCAQLLPGLRTGSPAADAFATIPPICVTMLRSLPVGNRNVYGSHGDPQTAPAQSSRTVMPGLALPCFVVTYQPLIALR